MRKMQRRNFLSIFAGSLISLKNPFYFKKTRNFSNSRPDRFAEAPDIVVKILGTAQDGGIPQLGCDCKNCSRARKNPEYSRFISSLAILDFKENKFFIVDATPDIRVQSNIAYERLRQETSRTTTIPQGVLLTHAHTGHYTGLMFFGFESISTHKLPVYCSSRMKEFLTKNGPWSQLVKQENISLIVISPNENLKLTPQVSVIPFQVPHRDEYSDALGFIISGRKKSLLYIPDIHKWKAWGRSITEEVEKVDLALLDGTFYSPEELPGRDLSRIGHPFIKESIDTLINVPKKGKPIIFFTHFNHSNMALDPKGEARKNICEKGFNLAAEGQDFFI